MNQHLQKEHVDKKHSYWFEVLLFTLFIFAITPFNAVIGSLFLPLFSFLSLYIVKGPMALQDANGAAIYQSISHVSPGGIMIMIKIALAFAVVYYLRKNYKSDERAVVTTFSLFVGFFSLAKIVQMPALWRFVTLIILIALFFASLRTITYIWKSIAHGISEKMYVTIITTLFAVLIFGHYLLFYFTPKATGVAGLSYAALQYDGTILSVLTPWNFFLSVLCTIFAVVSFWLFNYVVTVFIPKYISPKYLN